ncbi:uncharacterized protein N7459_002895 [Penicillium hispanicum]|uniref:uncharacterized protein n=1 Tax=Penicillium hispanicum TaxID=1080232 RepID=UPI00254111CD|nr:uncharacterized protein N7459_002895 [Penicillium hispanicum]KAJ5587130.1 hypothetical protein N7459_002895 [Penicillium hispanicum]
MATAQASAQTQPHLPWEEASPESSLVHSHASQPFQIPSTFQSPCENSVHDYVGTPGEITRPDMNIHLDQRVDSSQDGEATCVYNDVPQQNANEIPEDGSQSQSTHWNFNGPMLLFSQEPRDPHANEGEMPWLEDLSFDLEAFDSNMFRASRMDWLGCETDFSDQYTMPPLSSSEMQPIFDNDTAYREVPMTRSSSTKDQTTLGHPESDNQQVRPVSPEKDGGGSWPGILDRGGNEMWPFDYASNKGFRKIKLPPLREILEQTVGNLSAIKTSTVKDLIKVLSAPLIPSLNDSPALEALPAVAFLGQLVKTYFAEFHPALSIVHVPTWRIEKCPSALLAAIACIGATYSSAEGSQEVAALLAEITQRTLFWMGQADSRSFRNPAYIAASCLHQIYALGSGNRRLYELADASRGLLVTGLRELGVLSSDNERNESHKIDFQSLKRMDSTALEHAWNRWRDFELERRVAWSVFEFDCTLSTLTGKRGAFSISELPKRLPFSESLWEAPSANAWASVASFSTSPPSGIPFYPLLRNIISRKRVSDSAPAWAKRICALVITRLLWDLREMEDASCSDVLGLPSLADSHKASRENLLTSLMVVNDSLSRPISNYEVINMNVACLATHFAHISSGDETMDLVTFIFRNNYAWKHSASTTQLKKELSRAREHLRLRFGRDPIATRRSVRHAALVVSISRECTSFTPCETMRVFFSFAFLLAFAKFFPFDQLPAASRIEAPPIRLDELPMHRSQESHTSSELEIWMEHGGPASLWSVDDICNGRNFSALKEVALGAMENLRVWGLARKFHRILKNFSSEL